MRTAFARLHILLAREARVGLIIRHGTAKSVCTLLWDREKDIFTLGQWMRGRIAVETCDLSPGGRHFLYSAQKYSHSSWEMHYWTVVSRTPYLKAVAYYPARWMGGWFLNDREYAIPLGRADAGDRESPEVRRVEMDLAPKTSLYEARLARNGWSVDELKSLSRGRKEFVRPVGSGCELRHLAGGGYRLRCGDISVDTRGWDWADLDHKRLVWTMKGCLWTGVPRKDGIHNARLLHDFNGMKFAAIAAPYEGGRVVPLPKQKQAVQVSRVVRKASRKPVRKKPDRSRVQMDEE
jgi:hypothetical protein